ncbi:RNA-guided endonuclease InsQ/TnpB family protein [Frankia sp. AgPm24]|uniref:RNA-guided endonuclease InsQ/TnpB family protein n=1 Tax=Frankia sp. AgPm24 TaxID=631128 RepID=UPI0035B31145
MKRAYRYRFYPTPGQMENLAKTFGCVRYVYNRALAERRRVWSQERRRISHGETDLMLTGWKRDPGTLWLAEPSKGPLQAAPLRIVWSRPFPEGAVPSRVTVSRNSRGQYHVSILVDCPIEALPAAGGQVGVDVGITSLVTLSTGEKIANPRHERTDRARLVRAQRELSRKKKGSANRAKARLKVARIHGRIADRRRDHLHKLSTRLVRENQTIVVEDLTVRNMVRNHGLARAIADAGWRDLRTMLEYKAGWYGRDVVAVDRWYPSSKTCSSCGTLVEKLPLNIREWVCRCGVVHDRDVNAARNVLAAGLAVIACGDGVRPPRS